MLQESRDPQKGDDIAQALQVTRQVVVHEIALMRAAGLAIISTPRGYAMYAEPHASHRTVISVRHRPEETADELYTLVDAGITVENVVVDHPLYGELRGSLNLKSRLDVDLFLEQVRTGRAALLSSLTDGYHLHTVSYSRPEVLPYALTQLTDCGIAVLD